MQRTTSTNNVGSLPTYASGGETPGYYTDLVSGGPGTSATLVGASDLNLLQEELVSVILAAGLTLDGADATQLLQAVGGALAVKSHATTTGSATTTHLRALIASYTSTASGDDSAVLASINGIASGDVAAVVASSGSTASGTGAAVVASGVSTASGDAAAVVASTGSTASGDKSAVLAATTSTASGDKSAVIASTGSYASGAGSLCIGGNNVEVNTAGMIGGGDNSGASAITPGGINQGMKWNMDGAGQLVCQLLRLNSLETYADEAAAVAGGTLQAGDIYMTAAGAIRIKL